MEKIFCTDIICEHKIMTAGNLKTHICHANWHVIDSHFWCSCVLDEYAYETLRGELIFFDMLEMKKSVLNGLVMFA